MGVKGDFAMWDLNSLGAVPAVWEAGPSGAVGVRAVFFEGLPLKARLLLLCLQRQPPAI
jgi:hypothetical protein